MGLMATNCLQSGFHFRHPILKPNKQQFLAQLYFVSFSFFDRVTYSLSLELFHLGNSLYSTQSFCTTVGHTELKISDILLRAGSQSVL